MLGAEGIELECGGNKMWQPKPENDNSRPLEDHSGRKTTPLRSVELRCGRQVMVKGPGGWQVLQLFNWFNLFNWFGICEPIQPMKQIKPIEQVCEALNQDL